MARFHPIYMAQPWRTFRLVEGEVNSARNRRFGRAVPGLKRRILRSVSLYCKGHYRIRDFFIQC